MNLMYEEKKDGIIILDSKFATEIGFVCSKFEGYLWKIGDYIYISLIKSLNPRHGDLSSLFNSIQEKGYGIKVPVALPQMEAICRRKGFKLTTELHKEYNEAIDVWILEPPEKEKNKYELEQSWIKKWEKDCKGRCAILHLERCPYYENGECKFPETDMAKRLIKRPEKLHDLFQRTGMLDLEI